MRAASQASVRRSTPDRTLLRIRVWLGAEPFVMVVVFMGLFLHSGMRRSGANQLSRPAVSRLRAG
jgi:hypothetical protein